jgi:opacity protein-like surface antigen
VTGGLAYASIKHDYTIVDPLIPTTERFSAGDSRFGIAVGLGSEYKLGHNWSLKSEALYLKFQEERNSGLSAAGAQVVHFNNQDSIWVARFGLNYKFGGQ